MKGRDRGLGDGGGKGKEGRRGENWTHTHVEQKLVVEVCKFRGLFMLLSLIVR